MSPNPDRPSTGRLLVTALIIIVVVALLLVAVWAVIGLLAPSPAGPL